LLPAATLPLLDMALRRKSAAARLELSLRAVIGRRGATRGLAGAADTGIETLACGSARAGAGAEAVGLRDTESERVRLGAEEATADLPELDKALRRASANARPLIPCALLCCAMTSPVYYLTADCSGLGGHCSPGRSRLRRGSPQARPSMTTKQTPWLWV